MDITPQDTTQQPISDDQELAKALAGVLPDAPEPVTPAATDTPAPVTPDPAPADAPLQFEETPVPAPAVSDPVVTPAPEPATEPATPPAEPAASTSPELESIKKDALGELRPLIDHVDLPAEEKFDTYLMLIRSTDDTSLIGPAHTAAQGIADEKRRAEALLDIIKEIDYLSRGQQPPTEG